MASPPTAPTVPSDAQVVATPTAAPSKSPRVFQVGDSFPWMYRETVHGADGTERTCEIETTATIAALSIDLVWCDLEPVDRTAPEAVALGRPRVHVMKADAARLLGLPWPPAAE